MIVDKKEKYFLISSDEHSLKAFQNSFFKKMDDFKKAHVILQISEEINIENKEFSLFLKIAHQKQQESTSFIIVNSVVDIEMFPETINIVPTLQEAEDILEMEIIERSLGF
jgi:protein-disulfide isomerase-like protein with CxxC motif